MLIKKPFQTLFILAAGLMLLGCGVEGEESNLPTETQELILIPTATLAPTPIVTITPLPTPQLIFRTIMEIEHDNSTGQTIATAFWSEDGELIYYAMQPTYKEKPIVWYSYHLESGAVSKIADAPLNQNWFLDQYQFGLSTRISPSGRYVLHSSPTGVISDGITITIFKVFLTDTHSQITNLILEDVIGNMYHVDWSRDETMITFDVGYEGPSSVYVHDVREEKAVSVADIAKDHCGCADFLWSMSPDGSTLAIVGGNESHLQLIPLFNDEELVSVGELGLMPVWSSDSKFLYYWKAPELDRISLKVFDTSTETLSTIVTIDELYANGMCIPYCEFDVSPNGKEVLFWTWGLIDYIWVVEMRD